MKIIGTWSSLLNSWTHFLPWHKKFSPANKNSHVFTSVLQCFFLADPMGFNNIVFLGGVGGNFCNIMENLILQYMSYIVIWKTPTYQMLWSLVLLLFQDGNAPYNFMITHKSHWNVAVVQTRRDNMMCNESCLYHGIMTRSQYRNYHVKTKAAGVLQIMIFPLKHPSASCAFRVNHFTLNEPQLSVWKKITSVSFPPVLSGREVSTSGDVLTGLPYMQKLCTLTRNTLSDKKKKGGFTERPQQWKNVFVASVEFPLYACAKLEEFSSWYERCQNVSHPSFLLKLVNLRENSAISSSPQAGNTQFAR